MTRPPSTPIPRPDFGVIARGRALIAERAVRYRRPPPTDRDLLTVAVELERAAATLRGLAARGR